MRRDIGFPRVGLHRGGKIVEWRKHIGESVRFGEILCVVECAGKTIVDYEVKVAGVIVDQAIVNAFLEPGECMAVIEIDEPSDTVQVGDIITVEGQGESVVTSVEIGPEHEAVDEVDLDDWPDEVKAEGDT